MRIIFEEHQYKAADVEDILWEGAFRTIDDKISINYVGYYYNPKLNDCVFILPRVLLEDVQGEERVFVQHVVDPATGKPKAVGGLLPEDLIDPEKCKALSDVQRKFIFEFSVWIYRALDVYRHSKEDQSIIFHKFVPIQGRGVVAKMHTFLDVLLALVRFQKENHDFFMFTVKNRHSGVNKINWTRTVAHSAAVMSGADPVYLNPVNRKREVNFDEELFVIYYSILAHIKREYGFPVDIDLGYETIPKPKFRQYMRGVGAMRLRAIKYKYFSDRALKLWNLCYAFFVHNKPISVNVTQKEYLLAKSFDRVFEAIIDELIGAREDEIPDELKQLKQQKDGKLVDHIFSYRDLVNNDEKGHDVFYIGDSKYYKLDHEVQAPSYYKQFTYARNVVQFNLDLFLNPTKANEAVRAKFPKLRDDVTEGYNVIPNFFISARMTEDLDYGDDIEKASKERTERLSRQFDNRLFDRDTLLLSHYDVNFLWILSLYARNNAAQKGVWREKVHGIFRENIQKLLSNHFSFRAMTPKPGVVAENFLAENFQALNGKVFTPYADDAERTYYSLVLQKPEVPFDVKHPLSAEEIQRMNAENDRVLDLVASSFIVDDCAIGENPATKLATLVAAAEQTAAAAVAVAGDVPLTRHFIQRYPNDFFLVGYCPNDQHFNWMHSHPTKYKKTSLYNVRVGSDVSGGVNPRTRMVREPKFLILYNGEKCTEPWKCRAYRIRSVKAYSAKEMKDKLGYKATDRSYLCYELDEEVTFGTVDVQGIVNAVKSEKGAAFKRGDPIYRKGADIASFITG